MIAMLSGRFLSRFTVPIAGLLTLTFLTIAYLHSPGFYRLIMKFMITGPALRPFVDWEWMVAAVKCWSEGVNVYVNIPCYKVWPDIGFNYSPLWLRLSFLGAGERWINAAMLLVIVLFFLSLATLPPVRRPRDQTAILLTALSGATFLGFERGNADLLMFLLVITALNLGLLALRFRLAGYALLTLAGLLKFYPFVALIIVLRERVSVLAAVAAASIAALAALALTYHQELVWMSRNLPDFPDIHFHFFGSANLAVALGVAAANVLETGLHQETAMARAAGAMVARAALPLLTILALMAAVVIGRRCHLPDALARLSARRSSYLVVGAALICGCSFAIDNVIYRGVFFLLVLPGLAALSGQVPAPLGNRVFGTALLAIPFVSWRRFLDICITAANHWAERPYLGVNPYEAFPTFTAHYLLWLAAELAWWWIIIVLLAVLGSFILRSDAWTLLCRISRFPISTGAR